ncbi:hypothetical protein GCM10011348_12220 [Marinobacterium nitratireducens]|uniref:Uncharacterized protein n=1 Tax=Marinobacterium nitratireducens TaxID=518897 RepID=A0A917Z9L8_9GAMM|nr:hypothetical protein [Marinobacterium nitratireducens]GGO79001.1 hypothetical protein GCM10011348_12220 [Marinobacterium nitratireducens]
MLDVLEALRAWFGENPWRLLYLLPYLLVPFLVVPVYELLDHIVAMLM